MNARIFVIEDDENIREIINLALVSNGYEVVLFDNAIDALEQMKKEIPELAIFDLMLPKMNGIEAIKKIRETNNELPILILSAKDREIDKVNGLDSGSDDYMTKPFGILELQARVRSLLRRHVTSDVIKTKHLVVDKQTRIIKLDGKKLELTNKEYQLLVYLMDNKHRVVEREELLNEIWGYDFMGESRALDVHIRALRSKLNDDGHKYIKTIRSVGYRFYEEGDDSE
ncbi:MAG: response regulator transcription factor [[Clostridium] spiroforme]|uniref:Response regulator transcription factor n=1 Tax=Thomasclavelia spiroformis TaxID=29348 RepID=A0A943EGX3_9FIRM|nr:response regulator transcription factor [Thomasclavelia spiroformis]MBS5587954.1 response regulator transcription factor [Thomasclavelia spiroformis]